MAEAQDSTVYDGGYIGSLKAAGVVVEDHEYFGSYQGDILVKATFGGVTGFLRIGYGSCGGCDAYEAEMRWDIRPYCDSDELRHYGKPAEGCDPCQKAAARYLEALRAFGSNLIGDGLVSAADLLDGLIRQAEWDGDAQSMIDWVVARA